MEKQETYHYKKHKKDLTLSKSKHPHLFAAVSALSDKNYWIIKCKEDGLLRFLKADTLERYDSKDKELFDELGVLLCNWLQAYMMNIFQMERVFVPLKEELTEERVQAPIFISQDWYKNTNRALIFIQGTGSVRAGWWARSVWIKDNLDLGSMIPDIEFAIKNGFSVLVMNPNYDEDEYKNKMDDLVEPMIKHSN